eukprot:PhM_4_TR1920/c0_g1_i1/m.87892
MYMCVYGTTPFPQVDSLHDLYDGILNSPIEFPRHTTVGTARTQVEVPKAVRKVLKGCLTRDPALRCTVRQLLEGTFFRRDGVASLEVAVREWKARRILSHVAVVAIDDYDSSDERDFQETTKPSPTLTTPSGLRVVRIKDNTDRTGLRSVQTMESFFEEFSASL